MGSYKAKGSYTEFIRVLQGFKLFCVGWLKMEGGFRAPRAAVAAVPL